MPPQDERPSRPWRPVVLESPYAGDVDLNVRYARRAMAHALSLGEAPFASHLLYTQPGVLDDNNPTDRADGIEAGLVLGSCLWGGTVVYLDRGLATGMRQGIAAAAARGATIAFRRLWPPVEIVFPHSGVPDYPTADPKAPLPAQVEALASWPIPDDAFQRECPDPVYVVNVAQKL